MFNVNSPIKVCFSPQGAWSVLHQAVSTSFTVTVGRHRWWFWWLVCFTSLVRDPSRHRAAPQASLPSSHIVPGATVTISQTAAPHSFTSSGSGRVAPWGTTDWGAETSSYSPTLNSHWQGSYWKQHSFCFVLNPHSHPRLFPSGSPTLHNVKILFIPNYFNNSKLSHSLMDHLYFMRLFHEPSRGHLSKLWFYFIYSRIITIFYRKPWNQITFKNKTKNTQTLLYGCYCKFTSTRCTYRDP